MVDGVWVEEGEWQEERKDRRDTGGKGGVCSLCYCLEKGGRDLTAVTTHLVDELWMVHQEQVTHGTTEIRRDRKRCRQKLGKTERGRERQRQSEKIYR